MTSCQFPAAAWHNKKLDIDFCSDFLVLLFSDAGTETVPYKYTFAQEGFIFARSNCLATNSANAALLSLTQAQSPALGPSPLL